MIKLKKTGHFLKTCKRCKKVFISKHRYGKICQQCQIPNYPAKQPRTQAWRKLLPKNKHLKTSKLQKKR